MFYGDGMDKVIRIACEIAGDTEPGAVSGYLPANAWRWLRRESLYASELRSGNPGLRALYELDQGRLGLRCISDIDGLLASFGVDLQARPFEVESVRNQAIAELQERARQDWESLMSSWTVAGGKEWQ